MGLVQNKIYCLNIFCMDFKNIYDVFATMTQTYLQKYNLIIRNRFKVYINAFAINRQSPNSVILYKFIIT